MGIFEISIQLIFLLNPLASVPLLALAYKKGLNVRIIAANAVVMAFLIAIIFLIIGQYLFMVFGISINSFRAAGGIVIALLGLEMSIGRFRREEEVSQAKALISIIATPLLTGPATLSYLTITLIDSGIIITLISLFIAFVIVASVFIGFSLIIPKINLEYIEFASKIFGLFILAFGIEMLVQGIRGLIFT